MLSCVKKAELKLQTMRPLHWQKNGQNDGIILRWMGNNGGQKENGSEKRCDPIGYWLPITHICNPADPAAHCESRSLLSLFPPYWTLATPASPAKPPGLQVTPPTPSHSLFSLLSGRSFFGFLHQDGHAHTNLSTIHQFIPAHYVICNLSYAVCHAWIVYLTNKRLWLV